MDKPTDTTPRGRRQAFPSGAISDDMRHYMRTIVEMCQKLPAVDYDTARIAIHGLFDVCDRLEGLENAAHIENPEAAA